MGQEQLLAVCNESVPLVISRASLTVPWFHEMSTLAIPTAAPPSTSQVELTLWRNNKNAEPPATNTVSQSDNAARPSCQATTAINASDATFTPSRNAPATGHRRRRGTSGPLSATKRNAGRKIPKV